MNDPTSRPQESLPYDRPRPQPAQHVAGSVPAPVEAVPPGGGQNAPAPISWEHFTDDQKAAYFESTRERSSRKKPYPSLVRHSRKIRDCINGGAMMKVVFADLCREDPDVLREFGEDGYRKFNAAAKRMAHG